MSNKALADSLSEHGFCILPDVLSSEETLAVRESLMRLAATNRQQGVSTFVPQLDPNDANLRVFNLLAGDAGFRTLIVNPVAVDLVEGLLGPHFMVSNFTANVALPGSGSMAVHSDQAIVIPEPWLQPWAINIIWCLDDIDEENGATRYLPGSHRIQALKDVPADPLPEMKPLTASAGSIIAMDGRLWHTSGSNASKDRERALLFAYYTADFIRPQVNWNALLPADLISSLPEDLFQRLGLGPTANIRYGASLTSNHMP